MLYPQLGTGTSSSVHFIDVFWLLGCWPCSHLSPGALTYHFEMVLLTACTACLAKHWALSLTCVLHQSTYSCLLLTFCTVLCTDVCLLSQFSYPLVSDQSLLHFSFHLMLFSAPCLPQLLEPMQVPVPYLPLMFLWAISTLIISC